MLSVGMLRLRVGHILQLVLVEPSFQKAKLLTQLTAGVRAGSLNLAYFMFLSIFMLYLAYFKGKYLKI